MTSITYEGHGQLSAIYGSHGTESWPENKLNRQARKGEQTFDSITESLINSG